MPGKGLEAYRAKRDFASSPEPAGADAPRTPSRPGRHFVVQEHHARSLHWDLRLEHDGTLASWAIPKGVPMHPGEDRLAVRTEDHPLEYLEFEGDIPRGQYGAGRMSIWDTGTYEAEKWRDDEVIVVLEGRRVTGRYAIFRTASADSGRNWMIHRIDPPADPTREPIPDWIPPMLATPAASPPPDDGWAFEVKWDGIRAVTFVEGGRVHLRSRRGRDVTDTYPELRELGPVLGSLPVVLDGEVITFVDGKPSFERLQRRMNLDGRHTGPQLVHDVPVVLVLFDILWLDGHDTTPLPFRERRRLLEQLDLNGPAWQTPPNYEEAGPILEATRGQGLEGVVAKKLDSPYEPGVRSPNWVKLKHFETGDFVVAGWVEGEGGRAGRIGALVLAAHDSEGRLRYAGKVGSGLTDAELADLGRMLGPAASPASPLAEDVDSAVHWVEPHLVASVCFAELTRAGVVRAASWRGLRPDVDAANVTLASLGAERRND
ncbi:MAG: non-homologous end-joining DNA ligase [Acidimicrobiia bacterium]|nr:non-homologous end-joining DNA ligase [Acidimicrobiia bacterium]